MIIDLHTHVKLSKDTRFTLEYFQNSIQEAKLNGIEAIAMTEHFNTHRYHDIYDELDRQYKYQDDYYDVDGFKVFPGMEVDVDSGGHILVIGCRTSILELRTRLEPHTDPEHFVALEQLLDWCDELELLRIGAHPFRESNSLTQHDVSILKRLHAFDLNGKDLYSYGLNMRDHVSELADKVGIPMVGGSDTHHPLQFGSVINRLDAHYSKIADLAACLQQGRYQIEVSPCLTTKVKAAKMVKKLLKESGALAV